VSCYADDLGKPDWLEKADDKSDWLNRVLYLGHLRTIMSKQEGLTPNSTVIHPRGFSSDIPNFICSLLLNVQAKGFRSPIAMTVK
jgi:hypothetical protein